MTNDSKDAKEVADNWAKEKSWDEWKYRHDLFYRLMFRYATAVFAICVIPYLQPKTICEYNIPSLTFSLTALLIGTIGVLHTVLEFIRVVQLREIANTLNSTLDYQNFAMRHKVYASIRERIPFEYAMWVIITIVYIGIPLLLGLFGMSFIKCSCL